VSAGIPDLFGVPLKPDPAIALEGLKIDSGHKTGPMHKVQFVIEFVGPRSMAGRDVSRLLDKDWFQALGQPTIYVMRPSDLQWTRLVTATDGSFDSLALAWDYITEQGNISSASALQLLQFAERFGPSISRRAMPLPHPGDVNQVVRDLLVARNEMDIGFALSAKASQTGYLEKDLWIECARLGLDFAPGGTFDWKAKSHQGVLLSVSPVGATDAFSLRNVEHGFVHEGVTVGFRVPTCPAPAQALEGCFHVAEHIVRDLGGLVLDESGKLLVERSKGDLRGLLRQAVSLFTQLGITVGSPEALKLFGD
jgi:hypothetical protein